MRTLIIIAGIVLVAIVTLRFGAALSDRMQGSGGNKDGLFSSVTAGNAGNQETPEERDVRRLEDQQKLLEQTGEIKQEIQTAPLQRQTEIMQEEQQLIEQRDELTKERVGSAYDMEIERLRKEKELLEAQQELKETQEKEAEQAVREQPKIKPVTQF